MPTDVRTGCLAAAHCNVAVKIQTLRGEYGDKCLNIVVSTKLYSIFIGRLLFSPALGRLVIPAVSNAGLLDAAVRLDCTGEYLARIR